MTHSTTHFLNHTSPMNANDQNGRKNLTLLADVRCFRNLVALTNPVEPMDEPILVLNGLTGAVVGR